GIMNRFSSANERPDEGTAVSNAWLWKQFQCQGVVVTAKAIPMASAPCGTNRGSPARSPDIWQTSNNNTAIHRSIMVRHNYSIKFRTGKRECQGKDDKKRQQAVGRRQ